MNKPALISLFVIISHTFFGCVAPNRQATVSIDPSQKPAGNAYYQKGLELEQANRWVDAKEQYLLAITDEPSHQGAKQQLDKLDIRLQTQAQKHYEKSQGLKKKGKYAEATRHLRIALRLWPDHKQARSDLEKDQQVHVLNFFWHTIKKGESLSLVAKKYYGTTNPAATLARVNKIKDASKIRVGMELKIPQLKDHPFIAQPSPKMATVTPAGLASTTMEPDIDPLSMYRDMGLEFFNANEFENAIVEFKKVLNIAPDDTQAADYISRAYAGLGTESLGRQQYLNAIVHFKNSLAHNKGCDLCTKGIKSSQEKYKELHYKTGMKYFDDQKLLLAISEWNMVYEMDPGYKRTAELLEKAKTIQKNVEAIKKKQ